MKKFVLVFLYFQLTSASEFLWGTATAAFQIEGGASEDGRGPSIWDKFSHIAGKISNNDNGDVADDSYHKYLSDIQLLREIGVNSYRFSISWSRIFPLGSGEINQKGIDYYNQILNELVKYNIQPIVTLYHWDLPQGLHDNYLGWLSEEIEQDFVNYADVCFREFGDRVKIWLTINEPWTFSYLGYVTGGFAPGRCSDRSKCPAGDSATEGYLAGHNVLNAHAAAVELYRNKYQHTQAGRIGIALNHDWGEKLSDSPLDIAAAQRKNEFQVGYVKYSTVQYFQLSTMFFHMKLLVFSSIICIYMNVHPFSRWFGDPIVFGDYPASMRERVGDRLPRFTDQQRRRLMGSIDFWAYNHYTTKYISEPQVWNSTARKLSSIFCLFICVFPSCSH